MFALFFSIISSPYPHTTYSDLLSVLGYYFFYLKTSLAFPLWGGWVSSLTFTEAFRGHASKAQFSASVIAPHFNILCSCKILNLQSLLEFQTSSQNSRQERFPHLRMRCQTVFKTFKGAGQLFFFQL